MFHHIRFHTCDRVAMLQLEICKFWLEIWSHNWRFFIDIFDACFYCLFLLFVSVLNQLHPISICIMFTFLS